MRNPMCRTLLWLAAIFQVASLFASANTGVHTSWMWHMHQPIYWPDRAPTNHPTLGLASTIDHYQNAWDTIQLDDDGFTHPSDTSMTGVFGDANRIQDYQNYPHDAISSLLCMPNAGAQLNVSGALMENVQSLAQAGQYYGSTWYSYNQQAHGWTTSGGKTTHGFGQLYLSSLPRSLGQRRDTGNGHSHPSASTTDFLGVWRDQT